MTLYACSLGFKPPAGQEQVIPSGGGYTLLRFPYTAAQENTDPWDMHSTRQPDGRIVTYADPEAGLVRPTVPGWGCLELNVIWLDGEYTELHDVFVRDPLGTPDQTAYDHRSRTAGENCFTKTHWLSVRPSAPLGVWVSHNGPADARVRMAQLKLTIFTDVAVPPPVRQPARPGAVDPWPDMA